MSNVDVRHLFEQLVDSEPPFGLDAHAALESARTQRRRRSGRRVATATAALAAIAAILAVSSPRSNENRGQTDLFDLVGGTAPAIVGSPSDEESDDSGVFEQIKEALAVTKENDSVMRLRESRLGGDWIVDVSVEDEEGLGRLFIIVSGERGALAQTPCTDEEFALGARCDYHLLPDGSRLVLRHLAESPGGFRDIVAAIVHKDGSGVAIESGNYSVTPGEAPTPQRKDDAARTEAEPSLSVTRNDPAYDLDALETLVRDIDRRTADCAAKGCADRAAHS